MKYVLTDLLYGLTLVLNQTWISFGLHTAFLSFDLSLLLQADFNLMILPRLLEWTDGGVAFIMANASISFPHR